MAGIRNTFSSVDVCCLRLCLCLLQESERTEGVAPGIAPPLSGRGEGPEPRGAQGRMEGEGAETSGGHQNPARKTASAGENQKTGVIVVLLSANKLL